MLLLLRSSSPSIPPGPGAVFTVTNAGDADLHVGTVSIEDDGSGAFLLEYDLVSGQTIAAGEDASFVITFAPTVVGATTAIIHVPSDDPDGEVTAIVTGTGITTGTSAPAIAVDPPASWDAGDVEIVAGSATIEVTVSNTGTADLTVGTVSKTGSSFTISADLVSGAVIAPGLSLTLTVTFDPSSTGVKTGTLTIPSDDPGGSVVVALTGNGTAAPPSPTLVTRFYLGRQTAPVSAGIANGAWNKHTTDPDNALTVSKGGAAVTNGAAVGFTGVSGQNVRLGRWIGPPLAAQSFAGAFRMYLTCHRSSALGALVTAAARFGVWRAATSTVSWGSVLQAAGPVSPWEDTTDPEPRRFPAGADWTWSLSLTILDGDRLIVEAGYRAFSGGSTAAARIRWGGGSTDSDLAAAETTQVLTLAPWIDFSGGLLVLP